MKNPLVSVCCITYNHENYIEECLKSIIKQKTLFPFEIILGEDESTDATRGICIEYANKHKKKIKLILRSRKDVIYVNNKPSGRYNFIESLKACSGKYIAICEGDDFWTDSLKLQKQVDFLEANPKYSFCWTRFNTLDQSTQELTLDFNDKHFPNNEVVTDFDFETSLKGWHIGSQTLLFRRALIEFNVLMKFNFFRDIHLIAHLLKKGKGACLNFVGAVYRVHEDGIHSSTTPFEGYLRGYQCHKEIYLDNKTNIFLNKKYLLSFQNYINALIREGKLFKGFLKSIELFVTNWSLRALIFNFGRIVKKGFKNLG